MLVQPKTIPVLKSLQAISKRSFFLKMMLKGNIFLQQETC